MSVSGKPTVGEVHKVRIGIASLFGGESNFDSASENLSELSSKSSSSSSRKFEDRARPRPCIIWKTTPTIQVLVMSRFDDANVSDPNVRLFNHLTHEYVLKRLLAVSPKTSYGGRRSISATTTAVGVPLKTVNTNLILIPISVPKNWNCETVQEYFPIEELYYVNEILRQISSEDSEEQIKTIQAIDYPRLPSSKNDDVDNHDDNSSSSSLPKIRRELIDDIHCKKIDFVNQWLDHVLIENTDCSQSLNNSLDDLLVDNQPTVSPFDHI